MIESRYQGGKSRVDTETTYLVGVQPQPRIVASISCGELSTTGRCGGITRGDALECNWSPSLRDFACTNVRAYADWLLMTHPGERRFTLIGRKSLPVAKPGMPSFRSLQELGQRLRGDDALSGLRVMVDGIGLLAPLDLDQLRNVYVAQGLDDDMELRVFVFPRDAAPVAVPLRRLVDGHESEEQERVPDATVYTSTDEQWSVAAANSFDMGGAYIASIVLHDGKGRGLFWLAADHTAKPPVMSLLRIAADVGPYGGCDTFIYPASTSAVTTRGRSRRSHHRAPFSPR